ncbi:glycosyltransferase family 4 protein [Aliifodinibius sp. S!AR15-10]|uniref:glycosyltransferase family 4 protein n=1 Tax=Aliifodinibius sp. S!AR15-10 TaxID=2950437 RepID=UPI002865AD9E|nr:glycosyltransferase family 4 protein [Aliifodinibius sp. S!AR15-10]MDR8391763.1 glycosyltransferase family 4 protein [Aliifodinibius sp. S!AR15-10]
MKIAFIQTYPVYHDLDLSTEEWLRLENRDKWMSAILAADGHDVELLGVARESMEYTYKRPPFGEFPVRLFRATKQHKRNKKDYCRELVDYCRFFDPDLLFLKGVDGGVGIHLLDRYILPEAKPYVFVIGGKYYNRYLPKAAAVLYETIEQKNLLMKPWWGSGNRKIPGEKLFWLPKSIDTDLFRPRKEIPKEFDIISAGRFIPRKNHDMLGKLSNDLDVALIGDGPMREKLKTTFPELKLLGAVPHGCMPEQLSRGRYFFHTAAGDFFPRLIAEAMALGLPVIGFRELIAEEVIPANCGIRVPKDDYRKPVLDFVKNGKEAYARYSTNARSFVEERFGIDSSREPMRNVLRYLQTKQYI